MNDAVKMAAAATLGGGIGFFVGYKLLEKRLSEAFDERIQREEEAMREHYSLVRKPYASPQEALEDLVPEPPIAEDPREPNMRTAYHKIVQQEEVEEDATATLDELEVAVAESQVNIFDKVDRDAGKPYVISMDEFMANESGLSQNTLTYYETDDTLVDERDHPMAAPNDVIGSNFRVEFGVKSSDANTVHIRNEKLGLEFEVVRSYGSYKREVLGEEKD
jgi:hypothetical protein